MALESGGDRFSPFIHSATVDNTAYTLLRSNALPAVRHCVYADHVSRNACDLEVSSYHFGELTTSCIMAMDSTF